MTEISRVDHYCTRDEAKKLFSRRNGQSIMFGSRIELPTVDSEFKRAFPGYCVLTVTQTQAIKLVYSLLSGFEDRGARVHITETVNEYGNVIRTTLSF